MKKIDKLSQKNIIFESIKQQILSELRRNFLKIFSAGAVTLFLSGCGISAAVDEKSVSAQKNISGGQKMKIVLINSSPHAEQKSTSRFLAQKFVEGAKSSGHEIFIVQNLRTQLLNSAQIYKKIF